MKNDSKASDPKHLQHFFFLFRLKCSKYFDNFTMRIPSIFMSGVLEIIKPIKLTCSFRLSAFFGCGVLSLHYLFKVSRCFFFLFLSFINIICRIETHSILFKTWKQNKKHHLELLHNINKNIPQKQKNNISLCPSTSFNPALTHCCQYTIKLSKRQIHCHMHDQRLMNPIFIPIKNKTWKSLQRDKSTKGWRKTFSLQQLSNERHVSRVENQI